MPTQTPLSAGTAFTESGARAFEPLERAIEKEGILNHYLVRISHDATEALVSTIELFELLNTIELDLLIHLEQIKR